MSRLFDRSSLQYLTGSTPPVTDTPYTVSAWYYPILDATNFQNIVSMGDIDTAVDYVTLIFHSGLANDPLRWTMRDVGGTTDINFGTSTLNAWNHGVGIAASDTSRYLWVNGSKSSESTVSRNPNAFDTIRIAAYATGGGFTGKEFDGRIAEVGVWNVALTDDEVGMLYAGFSPLFVRPQSLVFYLPLIRDNDNDLVGGINLSATNTPTIAEHVSIQYPWTGYNSPFSVVAPSGNAPTADLQGPLFGPLGGPIMVTI